MKSKIYLIAVLSILSVSCTQANTNLIMKSEKQKNELFNFAKSLNGLNWMWSSTSSSPNVGTSYFRRAFYLRKNKKIKRAEVYLTSDNENSVFFNGAFIGSNSEWKITSSYNLKPYLKSGTNIIAIQVVNEGTTPSPAGLIGKIILWNINDRIIDIPIDNSFKCSDSYSPNWKKKNFDDSKWHNAFKIVPYGSSPWGMFDLANNSKTKFPEFIVPGHQKEMNLLRDLFLRHYLVPMLGTFNMQWVTESTLWPAIKPIANNPKLISYKVAISSRDLSDEGYVSCHQHRGLGLPNGWPFPTWWQSGGKGWHFAKDPIYNSPRTTDVKNWKIKNAKTAGLDETFGWELKLTSPDAVIESPAISVKEIVAPYIRFEWMWRDAVPSVLNSDDKSGHRGRRFSGKPYLEWTSVKFPKFSKERRVYCKEMESDSGLLFTIFPLHENPFWSTNDTLTKIRIGFGNSKPASVNIHAIFTAVDTRHDVNNAIYLQACASFINWTDDTDFLKNNIPKMRKALAYAIKEFQVESNKCVSVPWIGHDGRSGLAFDKNGKKIIRYGVGIGSGYWDIMPFGGKDALATIYLYDAINKMANLEQQIAKHPEWKIAKDKNTYSYDRLKRLAAEMKNNSTQFWNKATGRFGAAVDSEGVLHDYGYTFVNNEAVHYGFANEDQSTQIVDWIRGKRLIENDTSKGKDIYKFKFAPRASTKRNVEYYNYVWTNPESIPFGGQVQDGGAVLGFSYHDLMARLKTRGADDTWQRLKTIINWFGDIQKEGGYRKYYKNHPEAGTLQGGGPAGGLGVDKEFFESVLVPQVMIYGFMGFQPMIDGFSINPKLPTDWPSLKITKINLHGNVLDITVSRKKIEIEIRDITNPATAKKDKIYLPPGVKKVVYYDKAGKVISEINKKTVSIPMLLKDSRKIIIFL